MKRISVTVPDGTYEAFYRLYPGIGERTAFLRRVIWETLKLHKEDNFPERIAGIVKEKEEKYEHAD